MSIPLETASTTYKEISKILSPRFGKRGKARPRLPNEIEEASVLAIGRAGMAVRAAAKGIFLEPPNPFDSKAKRNPRRGVLLFGGLTLAFISVFVVSSFLAR